MRDEFISNLRKRQKSYGFVLKIKNVTVNVKDYELPYYFALLEKQCPNELLLNDLNFNSSSEEIKFRYIHNQDFVNIENLSEIKRIVELIKNLKT